jgi:hypothetical protein
MSGMDHLLGTPPGRTIGIAEDANKTISATSAHEPPVQGVTAAAWSTDRRGRAPAATARPDSKTPQNRILIETASRHESAGSQTPEIMVYIVRRLQ